VGPIQQKSQNLGDIHMNLRSSHLAVVAIAAAICAAPAATVSFSSGGNFTTFEVAAGTPLVDGHLHAGYYATDPSGLTTVDLRDSFQMFASFASNSGPAGFFGVGDFPITAVGGAAGQHIYLVVTDTPDVASANQIAVVTNTTDPDWEFPASDLGFTPGLSMDDIVLSAAGSSILTGVEGTATSGFPVIQLAGIPEPSTSLLALIGIAGLLRRRR
jgi:hypothetical protein